MPRRLRSPMLVGRDAELKLFDRLLAEACAGRGASVMVRGEAGVGKSRLLAEVGTRARAAGAAVLVGRAVEGGGAYRPLSDALLARLRDAGLPPAASVGPFASALARIVPGWAQDPAAEPLADLSVLISEGLFRLLRLVGEPASTVLVLDDLHWSDPDTLAVVDRLVELVGAAPVLLVLGRRDEPNPTLDRIEAGPSVHPVRLHRLSGMQTETLATACAEGLPLPDVVRRHVVEHAEGLPFLVEELLEGLVESGALVLTAHGWEAPEPLRPTVPSSVAGVVGQRMRSLTKRESDLIEYAALLGRSFDWKLLSAVTGLAGQIVLDELRVAVERGLLVYDEERADVFRFVHALTREAVRARIPPPRRVELVRSAAALVEATGEDPVHAAELHAEAGEAPLAARAYLAASKRAGATVGTREEYLRRAASLAPDDLDVSASLVEVLSFSGRADEARDLGDGVLTRLRAGDVRRSRVALTLARAALLAGEPGAATTYLQAAESGAAADALAAHLAFARHDPDEAHRLAERARQATDPAVRCEALEMVGRVARLRDQQDRAAAAFTEALSVAREHDQPLWQVRALHELGTLDLLGTAASERLELARDMAVRTGILGTAAFLDVQITACHALRVDLDATLTAAQRGLDLAESLRLSPLVAAALTFTALARGHTGEEEAMERLLDEAERRLAVENLDQRAAVSFVRGTPALVRHDLPALREHLNAGMELLRRDRSASPFPYRGLHVLVETAFGDGHDAREELRASGATVQAYNRGALAYADAAATARDGSDPSQLVARADEALAPLTWRRHHARLLVSPAALRDGWGSPVEWLREAMGHFTGSGDHVLARACRDTLRRGGHPVPRQGRGDSAVPPDLRRLGVTSRETDVLLLLAEGLSNRAVAARLVLSTRTVETHVTSLLAKTGADSRAALANYAPVCH